MFITPPPVRIEKRFTEQKDSGIWEMADSVIVTNITILRQ